MGEGSIDIIADFECYMPTLKIIFHGKIKMCMSVNN